jgi:hypothetical protein
VVETGTAAGAVVEAAIAEAVAVEEVVAAGTNHRGNNSKN